jgi:hypothetical protein
MGSLMLTLIGFFECKLFSMPCCLRKSLSFRAYGCLSARLRLAGWFRSKCCLQPRRFLSIISGDFVCLG